jgi:dienelactone hydrolase
MSIPFDAQGLVAERPLTARIPTEFVEQGREVFLEVVIFKPAGPGPFPALVFHHGSTGSGDDPSLFSNTWTSPGLAKFFTDRGWLVAFPQRRGRGNSDGCYDEGFRPDRSGYAQEPEHALPGVERALADVEASVNWVARRPDVDETRLLLGGQSRGGILAIAYSGMRPQRITGVLNFVGGWIAGHSPHAESINSAIFCRGAASGRSTLWLYGDYDPFYRLDHSRKNFEAFVAAGGKGTFHVVESAALVNGHRIVYTPALWAEPVDYYLTHHG